VMPIFVCTAVWLKSSYTISIGSSIVVMLISGPRRGACARETRAPGRHPLQAT
jgi:hypothetical protein